MFTLTFLLIFSYVACAEDAYNDHINDRHSILEEEAAMAVGGQISLNTAETLANRNLMALKEMELDNGFNNPHYFNFSRHYFQYRNEINDSKLYDAIKRMPKGAALHVHSSMMLGIEYILELTYDEHLYVCFADDTISLLFSNGVPQRPCTTNWEHMNKVRNASNNIEEFDNNLMKYFSLYTEDINLINADINTVWERFNKVYRAISSLLAYRPAREKYFYEALRKFYDDNVMYVEIRSGLRNLYELNGTVHDQMYLARLYERVAQVFTEDYPDFIGVKLIVTRHRMLDVEKVRETVELAHTLKSEMPNFFAGFDLVGQEDLGRPLLDFLPVLSEAKDLNYYFHAGETNWFGTSTDENLVDAILLGAKRLGHAYALLKHPSLIEAVKKRDIALEVNVVSNSVLSLVHDLRNHPLATFLAMGLPVVLSSDDPGVWGAEPLSHDFYVTFVGVASRRADLRTLKQLAINSIQYSALEPKRKNEALELFNSKWDVFIRYLNS